MGGGVALFLWEAALVHSCIARPTMGWPRPWRIAATVELSTPPLIAPPTWWGAVGFAADWGAIACSESDGSAVFGAKAHRQECLCYLKATALRLLTDWRVLSLVALGQSRSLGGHHCG